MPFREDLPRDAKTKNNRRGPRLNSRVRVAIEWSNKSGPSQFESAFTRVINNYGCLLVSPKDADVHETLRLTNLATRHVAEAIVVWKGARRPDGWDLGVELVSTVQDFWGMDI